MKNIRTHINFISILLFSGALLFHMQLKADDHKADSLKNILSKVIPDSVRVKTLSQLFGVIRFSDPLQALAGMKEAKEIALKNNNKHWQAGIFSKLGLIYGDLGHLEMALDNELKALQIFEEMKDTLQIAGMQLNVAMVYKKQEDEKKALEWLDKCLPNFKSAKSKLGEAYVYNNIAIIDRDRRKFDDALVYYAKSLKIKEEMKDTSSLGNGYLNIGIVYEDKGDKDKAMECYDKANIIYKATNNIKGLAETYINIGSLLISQNKLDKAKQLLLSSLEYCKRVRSKEDEQQVHQNLSFYYEKLKNYSEAIKEQNLSRACKDSILNESGSKQMALLQAVYETDKKDRELVGLKKDAEINDEQLARDNLLIIAAFAGIVLVFILLVLLFNSYRLRKRTNKTLAETNSLINYRKKEITDSISYARRIQESILPRFEKFNDIIPQSFLLHKPREIVSGDFYWIHRTDNIIYAAVADNLLHGVPGAFISMVGVNILNAAIDNEHITELDQLIAYVDKGISEMIAEDHDKNGQRRLDLSICKLDVPTGDLEYIGTDNPLFLVNSKGVSEIKSVNADGTFTLQKMHLKKGDTVYMFTDGYVDQMGGGEGKKMLTRKVSDILFKNWPVPMEKQKEGILREFENWRGNYDQVDDVLVMGIRI